VSWLGRKGMRTRLHEVGGGVSTCPDGCVWDRLAQELRGSRVANHEGSTSHRGWLIVRSGGDAVRANQTGTTVGMGRAPGQIEIEWIRLRAQMTFHMIHMCLQSWFY
jgi:hypothetical protein